MSALTQWLSASQTFFQQLGWLGVIAYAGIIVLVQFCMAPLSPVAVAGGFLFGLRGGYMAITLGTGVGAAVNFLTARYVARKALAARIGRNQRFRLIDSAIGERGWRFVALLRFCPIPYGFANFAFGLTAVRLWPYLFATIVAIIPANIFFVWLGASAQAGLEAALGANRPRHPFEYVMMGVGLVAALTAMVYVGSIARKAIAKSPAPVES